MPVRLIGIVLVVWSGAMMVNWSCGNPAGDAGNSPNTEAPRFCVTLVWCTVARLDGSMAVISGAEGDAGGGVIVAKA